MNKKIFHEEQKFRRWDVFFLLSFFLAGLIFAFIKNVVFQHEADTASVLAYLLLIGGLAVAFWYLWNLSVSIKVSEKRMSLKSGSLFSKRKRKIKWKDVEDFKFVRASRAAEFSGWGVRYSKVGKVFGFCGEKGLYISTKDGKKILICSRKIFRIKKQLEQIFPSKKRRQSSAEAV